MHHDWQDIPRYVCTDKAEKKSKRRPAGQASHTKQKLPPNPTQSQIESKETKLSVHPSHTKTISQSQQNREPKQTNPGIPPSLRGEAHILTASYTPFPDLLYP